MELKKNNSADYRPESARGPAARDAPLGPPPGLGARGQDREQLRLHDGRGAHYPLVVSGNSIWFIRGVHARKP